MKALFELADICSSKCPKKEEIIESELLGRILLNKVAGISFNKCIKAPAKTFTKEFMDTLECIYRNNIESNTRFLNDLKYLSGILVNLDIPYAQLKGAFLIGNLYPIGYRTSNDIDILISEDSISSLQKVLKDNGFIQGSYTKEKGICAASRREIIESRMNYGETIPFVKMIGDYPLEVDINFSVDYKPNAERLIVSEFLKNAINVEREGYTFYTLEEKDFLIHLCLHLYKEATTYDWVLTKRDLLLYKFSDINLLIDRYANKQYCEQLSERIRELETEKECYYAFENTSIIFPELNQNINFVWLKNSIKPKDLQFMQQIIYPREKKILVHDMNFEDWFDCNNRIQYLKEM